MEGPRSESAARGGTNTAEEGRKAGTDQPLRSRKEGNKIEKRCCSHPLEHEELTAQIIGAAICVHRELGPGFVESIYGNALAIEFGTRSIPYEREVQVPILYRGERVGFHRLDLFVFDEIVLELKALKVLNSDHFAIVRSYLRAIDCEHGLLLNFSKPTLEMRRVLARR
jgi:GxxExxY protein